MNDTVVYIQAGTAPTIQYLSSQQDSCRERPDETTLREGHCRPSDNICPEDTHTDLAMYTSWDGPGQRHLNVAVDRSRGNRHKHLSQAFPVLFPAHWSRSSSVSAFQCKCNDFTW